MSTSNHPSIPHPPSSPNPPPPTLPAVSPSPSVLGENDDLFGEDPVADVPPVPQLALPTLALPTIVPPPQQEPDPVFVFPPCWAFATPHQVPNKPQVRPQPIQAIVPGVAAVGCGPRGKKKGVQIKGNGVCGRHLNITPVVRPRSAWMGFTIETVAREGHTTVLEGSTAITEHDLSPGDTADISRPVSTCIMTRPGTQVGGSTSFDLNASGLFGFLRAYFALAEVPLRDFRCPHSVYWEVRSKTSTTPLVVREFEIGAVLPGDAVMHRVYGLDHPNVVRCLNDNFHVQINSPFPRSLLMEFHKGVPIRSVLGAPDLRQAAVVAGLIVQGFQGLAAIHQGGLCAVPCDTVNMMVHSEEGLQHGLAIRGTEDGTIRTNNLAGHRQSRNDLATLAVAYLEIMRSTRQPDGTIERRTREDEELPGTATRASKWVDQAIRCLEGNQALKGRIRNILFVVLSPMTRNAFNSCQDVIDAGHLVGLNPL